MRVVVIFIWLCRVSIAFTVPTMLLTFSLSEAWGSCTCGGRGVVPCGVVCCSATTYCDSGFICTDGGCLSRSSPRVCPNGQYCTGTNAVCTPENECISASSERYCGSNRFCDEGELCTREMKCISRTSERYCGGGTYCPPGHYCRNGGCRSHAADREPERLTRELKELEEKAAAEERKMQAELARVRAEEERRRAAERRAAETKEGKPPENKSTATWTRTVTTWTSTASTWASSAVSTVKGYFSSSSGSEASSSTANTHEVKLFGGARRSTQRSSETTYCSISVGGVGNDWQAGWHCSKDQPETSTQSFMKCKRVAGGPECWTAQSWQDGGCGAAAVGVTEKGTFEWGGGHDRSEER